MTLEEVRQKYPQYSEIPDRVLADKLYQKYYSDKLSRDDFMVKIGLEIQSNNPPESAQELQQGTALDQLAAPVTTMAGNIGGSIYGGLAGIGELIASGNIDNAVKTLNDKRKQVVDAISVGANTEEGKRGLKILENTLNDIDAAINYVTGGTAGLAETARTGSIERGTQLSQRIQDKGLGKSLGEEVLQRTGSPIAATGAELIPSVAEIATGRAFGKKLSGEKPAPAKLAEDDLIKAGKKADIPLLTSDVFPPESFIGKHVQSLSEKLGALGSGSARQSQQVARKNVVEGLASEYGVELDSPFFKDIIGSMSAKNAKILEVGNLRRKQAIDSLSNYGEVPLKSTNKAIDSVIEKQRSLKDVANESLTKDLEDYRNAMKGGDFEQVASVRTELISQIKDLERSDSIGAGRRAIALSKAKQAIDEDMLNFAKKNDRNSAALWIDSTRKLAEQLNKVKQSELKRMLDKGDVKPEMVATILKGGKRSELQRLNSSLTPKGRSSARAAIIKDLLDKSGFFRGDINPNKLATEMSKTNAKQAIDIMFNDKQKAELDGLVKLLNATRRAQDASLNVQTGQQLIPFAGASALGYGASVSPIATIATATTLSGVAKAYESTGFRNLLMRIKRAKAGSKQERKLLESAIPLVAAGLQAAKTEQAIQSIPE